MLLQPLIENAIKYAVSPQEEGARISLTARVVGERLRISVEDSGPGLQTPAQRNLLDIAAGNRSNTVSTGVGLVNIRSRLNQAYGDNHIFETRSTPGGGFTVFIEIPFERAPKDSKKAELNGPDPLPHPAQGQGGEQKIGSEA